jgi:hypothetical protein
LPGEQVELRGGDVWVDGNIATKDLSEMRALRQLVHEETDAIRRWHVNTGGWSWRDGAWQVASQKNATVWHWLSYRHPDGKSINADTAYNAGLTQRLFPVHDLALSAKGNATGNGSLILQVKGHKEVVWKGILPREAQLEFFAFDRQLRVFIDGNLIENIRAGSNVLPMEGTSSLAIGVKGLQLELRDVRIYHDIYYASQNEERGVAEPMTPIVLGPHEVFVLGDNVPVSLDSRLWGPVPLGLLVGKPVGVR